MIPWYILGKEVAYKNVKQEDVTLTFGSLVDTAIDPILVKATGT